MSFIPVTVRDNLVHFIGKQGSTWSCNITLLQYGTATPIDLTTYSVRGQIRRAFSDTTPIASFTCSKVDAVNGVLNITLSAAATEDLTACKTQVDSTNYSSADKNGIYYYDVEIYKGTVPDEIVYRAVQGNLYVDPEVTK